MRVTVQCHCGAVRLSAELRQDIAKAARCTCSFCRGRQAANVSASYDTLQIEKGAEALRLYQFGTMKAEHYFCGTCGLYTHHRRFSDPTEVGLNIGLIEGTDIAALEPLVWHDGGDRGSP